MNIHLPEYFDANVIEQALRLLDENRQKRFCVEPDQGRIKLTARYPDHFNFVDKARVLLDGEGSYIISAKCDCAEGSFCCHCAALLLRYAREQQDRTRPGETFSASEPEAAPSEPIRFEDLPTEAPVTEEGAMPEIRDLSYGFYNAQAHLYPGVDDPHIPLERFQMVFGNNFRANMLYKRYSKWGGSCYGMSSSSGLFYHPGNNISVPDYRRGASYPGELKLTDRQRGTNMTLHTFIEAMHITQMGSDTGALRANNLRLPLPERLKALCDRVDAFQQTGAAPVVMDVWQNERFDRGHSVLPYRHERLDRSRSRLHIYDPNCPGQVRYCDLVQDSEGNYKSWRFKMSDNSVYSSDQGSVISFVPHEHFQGMWDNRAQPKTAALFSTSCEDLTVRDESGGDVLKICAGAVTSLREDVVPILVTDGEACTVHDVWINPGTYRVINDDPEQELSFQFVGEKGSVEVETDSREVVATVDDEQDVQKVEIVEKGKKFKTRLLSLLRDVLVRGVGSALGTLLGNFAKGVVLGLITADSVTEFKINGEDANAADYILPEEHEEAEQEEDEDLYCTNDKAKPEGAEE